MPCRQFGQLRKKRKNRRKKTQKEGTNYLISPIGWFRKNFANYPDSRKSPAGEAKVLRAGNRSLFFTLKLVLLAVDVSCCPPIADTRAGSLCVKPPRSQRRRYPHHFCFIFFAFPFQFTRSDQQSECPGHVMQWAAGPPSLLKV